MPEKSEYDIRVRLSKWQEILYKAVGEKALRTVNEGTNAIGYK
jgi:hypothetical protein